MSKSLILLCSGFFGFVGAYVPFLFGDSDMFSGWSILLSTVGGLFGIWFAVWLSKKMS